MDLMVTGAYPYFESQKIICTDIEEGLYVLNPTYVNASRVHVQVVDRLRERLGVMH